MTPAPGGRVVVVGDALIDELRDGANVRELIGGAALNVAVGLSRLGVATTLVAMVGDDVDGDHVRAYLADYGVALIATASPLGTARAIVTRNERGEPAYAFTAAARERRIRYGAAARAAFAEAAFVVVSCVAFDDAAQTAELDDALAGTDAALAIDPNPREGMLRDRGAFVAGFERLARRAVLVKIGADDAALLYRAPVEDVRDRLRAAGAGAVLSTRGARGAEADAGAVRVARPIATLPGRVVDTTGAGDATLAAVVAALRTEPPTDAASWASVLDRAMAIAAATCRFEGALLRLPSALEAPEIDGSGT